ncbi:MAG: VOC family protein [Flavobacterium sp.]|nr:VOC family protein [Flavobacterium sp.]
MKKKSIAFYIIVFGLLFFNAKAQNNFLKPTISLGILAEDLNKSIDFYTNVVGMVQVREFVIDSNKAKRMGLSQGEKFDIKVLKLENIENATELKLMSFNKKTDHSKQKYLPDSNGIRYLTIYVKSLQPVLQRINQNNIKTLGQTPTMLDAKRQFVLIQDPDGNFVEFISSE